MLRRRLLLQDQGLTHHVLAGAGASDGEMGGRCHGSHAGQVEGYAKSLENLPGVDQNVLRMLEAGLYDSTQDPVFGLRARYRHSRQSHVCAAE